MKKDFGVKTGTRLFEIPDDPSIVLIEPKMEFFVRISMEIAMTDESVLIWLTEVLGCGTLNKKPRKNGHKMQYRWRCVFRDAFHVCCILFPYAHVKLDKITKVIEHYSTIEKRNNIYNLDHYRSLIK